VTDVFISDIRWSVGARRFSVEESAAAGRTVSTAAQLSDAGFESHWVCAPDETGYDLARTTVQSMGGGVRESDALAYATCLPQNAAMPARASRDVKHLMDFPASRLQSDCGLERAIVFGLSQQACTSMLGSLRLARAMLLAEPELSQFVCVSADRFPDGALYEQSYSLISDGAAGCIVNRNGGDFRIVAAHHITNGAMVHADDDETVGSFFSYIHRIVTELLERAGLGAGDVDWVVPQNLNVKAWTVMSRLLGLNPNRVWCPTVALVGHVISSDNLINLAAALEAGTFRSGDHVLLTMAGYGMNWQATLLQKT
jgi:3-oxoacyl-[acyl-carrier-protein] synthase-3